MRLEPFSSDVISTASSSPSPPLRRSTDSPRSRPRTEPSPAAQDRRPKLSPKILNGQDATSYFFASEGTQAPPAVLGHDLTRFDFKGASGATMGASTGGDSAMGSGGSNPFGPPTTSGVPFLHSPPIRGPASVVSANGAPSTSSTFSFLQTPSSPSFPPPNTTTFSLPPSGPFRTSHALPVRPSSTRFTSTTPSSLLTSLSTSSPALVLDIRTHTAWTHARLRSSLNICVPSTLLRRPAYGIDRVADGLTPADKVLFSSWETCESIYVLDADSLGLVEGGGVASLLAKFERAGFSGRLGWIKGGFAGVRTAVQGLGVEGSGWMHYGEEDSMDGSGTTSGHNSPSGGAGASTSALPTPTGLGPTRTPSLKHARPVLQVRDLPVSAFQQASTSAFTHAGLPTASKEMGGRPKKTARPGLGKRRKSGGEGFGLMLDMPKGNPMSPAGSMTPGGSSIGEKRMASNPFFDNIRQNSEALSLTRSLANLSPIDFPPTSPNSLSLLPPFLSSLLALPPIERAQLLARQFYELELAERERLERTMNWHATVQGTEGEKVEEKEGYRKFGISAGVELGNLNRFKNIFPYDHARVRLQVFSNGATDYINASHVQVETSSKRFIASQGPLQTTFSDFWQMCEQEHVGVIIMLTNLHEGGREKCGRYWMPEPTATWDVFVDGGEAEDERHQQQHGEGFFAPAKEPVEPVETTIRRTISIRKKNASPETPPRKIRHIQYRAWPDFDIPAAPSDVVGLVREVERAQEEYMREIVWTDEVEPPILAHCSAGVGRTGVFIMVATMLEKLRKDRQAARKVVEEATAMDIDAPPSLVSNDSFGSTSSGSTASSSAPLIPIPSPSSIHSDTASLAAGLSASTLEPSLPGPVSPLPPLLRHDPIYAAVNELREQRMSMVANFRQYVCVHECTLVGALEEMEMERARS